MQTISAEIMTDSIVMTCPVSATEAPAVTCSSRKAAGRRIEIKPNPELPMVPPESVPAPLKPDDGTADIFAQVALHPTLQAANTIQSYSKAMDGAPLDLEALIGELGKQVTALSGGDLARTEAMLIAQAHLLDAIFNNLARRAAAQEFLPQIDGLLRLALKAQSQCRATLETLAAIKNPPVLYAKQANVTSGPQQINNGVPSQGREIGNAPSKLLETQDDDHVDCNTTGAAVGVDSELATVGQIDRPEVGRG
jgi:hypothetical protein